jgi:signal transduction histidine kinase
MIAVLVSATFLSVPWAIATAVLAIAAPVLGFALSTGFGAVDEWLPALMLHVVLSPLILVLSHQRARVEARRIEQLRERELRLVELQHLETLGRLAAGVAHDFNNLLCIVSLNTQQLLNDRAFSEKAIGEIRDAAGGATRLVQQLLTFTRKQESTPRPISLNQVIVDLKLILRRVAGDRVELNINCASALPYVKLDPVQLERVRHRWSAQDLRSLGCGPHIRSRQ